MREQLAGDGLVVVKKTRSNIDDTEEHFTETKHQLYKIILTAYAFMGLISDFSC